MEYIIQGRNTRLGKMVSDCQSVDLTLTRSELFELDGKKDKTDIKCLDGILWVTQCNDPEDHFIHKGQTFVVTHPGRVLIQGLPRGKARVSLH